MIIWTPLSCLHRYHPICLCRLCGSGQLAKPVLQRKLDLNYEQGNGDLNNMVIRVIGLAVACSFEGLFKGCAGCCLRPSFMSIYAGLEVNKLFYKATTSYSTV